MKIAATTAFVLLMTLPCKADDDMYKAYVLSLFSEPGKAVSELETLAASNPLLISYALALFTEKRCGTPKPSTTLIKAAGGDGAFATEAGKKIFAVAGVVAAMTYSTPEAEAGFSNAARKTIAAGEDVAASHYLSSR